MYFDAKGATIMPFDASFFDAGPERSGTASVKWSQPGVCPEGHIPLWVADMDFACAPAITEALVNRAGHPSYGYTYAGDEDRQAFCSWWQRRHGVSLKASDIGLLPSVVSGLRVSVEEFTKPGEGVIIQPPVYGPFFASIEDAGRKVLEAPLRRGAEGYYTMDLDAVEACLKQGARLMILCNPHNPVGRAWSREELLSLTGLLGRYDCMLISDEIHADFVYSPASFTSLLSLNYERLLVLAAASKTFNLAGLQQANIVCRDASRMRAVSARLHRAGVEAGNLFALTATRAAYEHGAEWLDGLLHYLSGSRNILADSLKTFLPEAILTPIEATYLAWVDVSAYGTNNEDRYRRCEQALVLPTNGTFFGKAAGEGFMRLNFGCPRGQLTQGLERFAKALNGYGKG